MVRFIFSLEVEPRSHVGTEKLRELNWLTVTDRVRFFKLQHVFRIRFGLAPDYLGLKFEPISNSHSHCTRGSAFNYRISKDLARCQTSFAFTSIKDWNFLPASIKECSRLSAFRSRLKEHFWSSY